MKIFLKKIGSFFKRELRTLIMAVIISIIIWFAVSIQMFPNISDHIDKVPVTAEPTSYMQQENLQITDYDKEVTIQIHGKRYVIGSLTTDDFTASLDLSGINSPGTHTVPIILNTVQNTSDYEIVSKNLTASVQVERIIAKEISLQVNTSTLTVEQNLQIQADDIELSSDVVRVTGEQSLVESISRAVLEPVYDKTVSETTRMAAVVNLYDSKGTKIDNPKLSYQAADYTMTVPVYRVKTLPLNISFTYPAGFDSSSLKYTITPSEITIAAPAADVSIESLERIDVGEVDLSDITFRDLQGIRLPISLGEGYKNLSNYSVAQVSFKDTENYSRREFSVSTENFTVLNGSQDYDYSFVTGLLDITAVGPSDILFDLNSDDIIGTVNMLGTPSEEGTKNVTVSIRISGQNVNAWICGDYKLDISVKKK